MLQALYILIKIQFKTQMCWRRVLLCNSTTNLYGSTINKAVFGNDGWHVYSWHKMEFVFTLICKKAHRL